jgi:hypothetical protein
VPAENIAFFGYCVEGNDSGRAFRVMGFRQRRRVELSAVDGKRLTAGYCRRTAAAAEALLHPDRSDASLVTLNEAHLSAWAPAARRARSVLSRPPVPLRIIGEMGEQRSERANGESRRGTGR